MVTSSFLITLMVLGAAPDSAPGPAAPAADQSAAAPTVRGAIERSLVFLEKGAAEWRAGTAGGGQNNRVCVTCHTIPFTIWSENEALVRGFAINQAKHDDLANWALDWCTDSTTPKTGHKNGGFLGTMQQLIMAHDSVPKTEKAVQTFTLFEEIIASVQKPEGFWKEGNQISVPGAEREANEVDTMWTVLGLTSLERLGERLPEKTRTSLTGQRQRAYDWLKDAKPETRNDWLALRILIERDLGQTEREQESLRKLKERQNPDGGWGLAKGGESHALVTGQCLYAMMIAGVKSDEASIGGACRYLVQTQHADGSWKASSRRNSKNVDVVFVHWGTGWATLGLLQTLPKIDKSP